MTDATEVCRMVEALLFAAAEPLSAGDLESRLPAGCEISRALVDLVQAYAPRGVNLVCVAGRWRFQTAEDLAFLMRLEREEPRRLSRAAQETLAIIAYHQPVTRADIESVRGVQVSRGTLEVLLELRLVRMRGRRRSPGRPITYGTTEGFLEHYGLPGLGDLPGIAEMKAVGLLGFEAGADFAMPPINLGADEEDLFDASETPDFHQDFMGAEGGPSSDSR